MASRLKHITTNNNIQEFQAFRNSCSSDEETFRVDLEKEDLRRRQAVHSWLKAVNMENDHYHFRKLQHPNTGRWLLENSSFIDWFSPEAPSLPTLLWLNGKPGAGGCR
jgi:hypothetical protein